MWWAEIASLRDRLAALPLPPERIASDAVIELGAVIDERDGPVVIGAGTRVCAGAILRGPLRIGPGCLIGHGAFLRGPLLIGAKVAIGYCAELKQALVADGVSIGPMCFVADSRVDRAAYLGAMVRTSNQRLDRAEVRVPVGTALVGTGLAKLGCWIGADASLGIQVIVLPGRTIAAGSLIEPRVTIVRNLPRGHYRLRQDIETVTEDPAP